MSDYETPIHRDVMSDRRGAMRKLIEDLQWENARLRAALEQIAGCEPYMIGEWAITLARAAVAEGVKSPDERADYHGFEDGLTENPCGREDFEPRAEARHIRT